ncbi:hypothetical protein D7231_35930 [Streptomyces klenkii]|uniref:PKD domain-containing protein n=1 Tax=Streptomyces klenkii TaxID=1420899 RepID=A0A3A9ZP54_9ACTN|nr:hypothetical protein [Streptomyces klenkii]RKN49992.1 hypothetical protein D7231_35930 [Streptomyces klenkii]
MRTQHEWEQPGTYTVTVHAALTDGTSASAETTIQVVREAEDVYQYRYDLDQGWAIDLASRAPDHDRTDGEWGETRNFEWFGKDSEGGDGLSTRGWPDSVTWLAENAPSTRESCLTSPRPNGDGTLDGLHPGERFCVVLDEFEALITIIRNTAVPGDTTGQLTIDVRVWD